MLPHVLEVHTRTNEFLQISAFHLGKYPPQGIVKICALVLGDHGFEFRIRHIIVADHLSRLFQALSFRDAVHRQCTEEVLRRFFVAANVYA